jgi:hypothetical protein
MHRSLMITTTENRNSLSNGSFSQAPTFLRFVHIGVRVARWFIFKPKIPIWVNFVRP